MNIRINLSRFKFTIHTELAATALLSQTSPGFHIHLNIYSEEYTVHAINIQQSRLQNQDLIKSLYPVAMRTSLCNNYPINLAYNQAFRLFQVLSQSQQSEQVLN